MKKLLLALFLALGSGCLKAGGPAHVIITAGQSNTDGRVPNDRLPEYIKAMATDTAFTQGAYKYCKIAQNRTDGKFRSFWPKSRRRAKPNTWGYDAVAYYWLEQLYREKFYVIKWAIGGTAIEPSDNPKGTYWSADPKWLSENVATSEKGKSLLLSFIANIDACIDQTLSKLDNGYQIDAFVWHQGESDQKHGKEYYKNLKAVVSYVRNYLTEKTGKDYSQLPFIFGTVSKRNRSYSADVEEGMKRLAKEDKNAYLIDMSDAELLGDKLHFNQVSAEYMGKQVYEQIKKLTKKTVAGQDDKANVAESPIDIDLWKNGLPNTNGMESQGYDDKKHNFKPCIRVYLPKTSQPARAVVICPGGGYEHLAMSHEGYAWGDFFNEQGIAAIVLKYRMPNGNREVPMSDAYEAIRYTKEHATEWNINPDDIGIMGFSAGGHLASTIATHAPEDLRPTFQILFYPVISMEPIFTHRGSRKRFVGDDATKELEKEFSNEFQVTSFTPKAFITLSDDDRGVKPMNSIRYYSALKEKGVPAAMHIYPSGGHGWGIKNSFKFRNEMLAELKAWLASF